MKWMFECKRGAASTRSSLHSSHSWKERPERHRARERKNSWQLYPQSSARHRRRSGEKSVVQRERRSNSTANMTVNLTNNKFLRLQADLSCCVACPSETAVNSSWNLKEETWLWDTLYPIESVESWSPSLIRVWHGQPRHLAEVLLEGLLGPGGGWKSTEQKYSRWWFGG